MKYVPFLKFKSNEVLAFKELDPDVLEHTIPFFDIPRDDNLTAESLMKKIDDAAKKIIKHLPDLRWFYVDNFDIDDNLKIAGYNNYNYIINTFSKTSFIPVVGLDRSSERIRTVFEARDQERIMTDAIAIRLTPEDFISWKLLKDDFDDLMSECTRYFRRIHLVLDNRVLTADSLTNRTAQLVSLITEIQKSYHFEYIINSGSSIPASIADILATGQISILARLESILYKSVNAEHDSLIYGDYTVISPLYSDPKVPKAVLRKIMAPKLLYSFNNNIYIARGYPLDGHPRGAKQYNDMAQVLIGKAFYRKHTYSWGDQFIDDKANNLGNSVTPSSIVKPLVNAHITYIFKTL